MLIFVWIEPTGIPVSLSFKESHHPDNDLSYKCDHVWRCQRLTKTLSASTTVVKQIVKKKERHQEQR